MVNEVLLGLGVSRFASGSQLFNGAFGVDVNSLFCCVVHFSVCLQVANVENALQFLHGLHTLSGGLQVFHAVVGRFKGSLLVDENVLIHTFCNGSIVGFLQGNHGTHTSLCLLQLLQCGIRIVAERILYREQTWATRFTDGQNQCFSGFHTRGSVLQLLQCAAGVVIHCIVFGQG